MTRDKILSDLFTSKDFTSCISKMKPENLQDELKAEVALILCEMDELKLVGLAQRKELKFYTVRIILNLIQSNTSPFFKKFRISNLELHEIEEPKFIEYDERKDLAINEIENMYWYDRELLKLYIQCGTYRAVEELTGIPFESVYQTIRRCCKEIKKKVA